jgi:hypothetical protein
METSSRHIHTSRHSASYLVILHIEISLHASFDPRRADSTMRVLLYRGTRSATRDSIDRICWRRITWIGLAQRHACKGLVIGLCYRRTHWAYDLQCSHVCRGTLTILQVDHSPHWSCYIDPHCSPHSHWCIRAFFTSARHLQLGRWTPRASKCNKSLDVDPSPLSANLCQ